MVSKQKKEPKSAGRGRAAGFFVPSRKTAELFLRAQVEQHLPKMRSILKKAWCKETSSDKDNWSERNPAWGQCAVSALFVNDVLGGKIVWAEAILPDGRKISHYFNLVHGKEIDLTRGQFPEGTAIAKGIDKKKEFPTTRDYILSYESTRARYGKLSERISALNAR